MRKKWKAVLSVLLTGGIVISSAACSGGNEDLVSTKGRKIQRGKRKAGILAGWNRRL